VAGQVTFNDIPETFPRAKFSSSGAGLSGPTPNKAYLKQADELFDRSLHAEDLLQGDPESLSGFAHIRGDRGYIFLLNPSPVEQIAELTLALEGPPFGALYRRRSLSRRHDSARALKLNLTLKRRISSGRKASSNGPRQVRILWIVPAGEKAGRSSQPEDMPAAGARRYVGAWSVVHYTPELATLGAQFVYPGRGGQYLQASVPESAWAQDPWAYDKAYMVFLLKRRNATVPQCMDIDSCFTERP